MVILVMDTLLRYQTRNKDVQRNVEALIKPKIQGIRLKVTL